MILGYFPCFLRISSLLFILLVNLKFASKPILSFPLMKNSCVSTETKTSTGCRVRLGKSVRQYKHRDEEIRQYFQASRRPINVKVEKSKYKFFLEPLPLLGAWRKDSCFYRDLRICWRVLHTTAYDKKMKIHM